MHSYFKSAFVIIIVVSLVMVTYGDFLMVRAELSESWPTSAGKVTRSQVVISQTDEDSATFRIAYEFVINEICYTSDVYRFGANGQYSTISITKAKHDKYPVGGNVIVAYNPSNPADAVLEPGVKSYGYLFVVLGVGFGILSPLFYWIKYGFFANLLFIGN